MCRRSGYKFHLFSMDSDSDDDAKEKVVDIGKFIEHYNYIKDKVWPLASLVKRVERIRR